MISDLNELEETAAGDQKWWKVAEPGTLDDDGRLHVCVEGRFITVFRSGNLSAIDSVCHHAGGPMTDGVIQDIEELGVTVVLCPWHRFMVSIDSGLKAFQGVEIVNGARQCRLVTSSGLFWLST